MGGQSELSEGFSFEFLRKIFGDKLVRKKLFGINESTLGVLEQDEWQRQILHIWATDEYVERILYEVFLELLFTEPELVRDTLIMVTVTSSWWIFYQDKY